MSEGLPASAWVPRTKFVRPVPPKDAVIDLALLDRVARSLAEVPKIGLVPETERSASGYRL